MVSADVQMEYMTVKGTPKLAPQRAESAVAADVNWNQHIIPLKTLVYCTVCCILPPINQACVESYNRQSSTEGVVCSSGMTSTAQNLRWLPTHSEQVVEKNVQFTVQVFTKPVYSTCIHKICTGMYFNQQ